MRMKNLAVLGLALGLAPAVSLAEVEISGYLSFAATYADSDNTLDTSYYNALANTDHADFDTRSNHVGIQLYSALTDKVSVTVALTAEGGQSDYQVEPEWAYGTYQFNDDWGLRMGRWGGAQASANHRRPAWGGSRDRSTWYPTIGMWVMPIPGCARRKRCTAPTRLNPLMVWTWCSRNPTRT